MENASISQSLAGVKSDELPRRGALVTALGIVEILSWRLPESLVTGDRLRNVLKAPA
jgi:hypothetical protein